PGRRVTSQIPPGVPDVRADPALLERILANVISNALRFNPSDEKVLVTASALGDRVELRVIDRGPGIPPTDRDRVFLPFQRLDDRDNHMGVGLGLALARGLAEAMGGSLAPDETPGGGLTMILSLPAAYAAVPEPVPGGPALPDAGGPAGSDEPPATPDGPAVQADARTAASTATERPPHGDDAGKQGAT
ncbi:MAG: sensor histidine kinase, partial [Actinomadura sp.]